MASLGLRVDNLFESVVMAVLLMCVFYAGRFSLAHPLVSYSGPITVNVIYFYTEIRYEIHYNGKCTRREKPLSLYHLCQRIAARYSIDRLLSNF